MSIYDIEAALHRLRDLGVDITNLHQDYNKIPLENVDLTKVEMSAPKKDKIVSKHTVIIDSRQRDYTIYPTPSNYLVELMEPHRSVEKIELIAAMLPKTEYNVSSENNLVLLTINGLTQALYLNEGQYLIGSNQNASINYITDGAPVQYGLMAEMIRVLNTHTNSANAFNVFLATTPNSSGGTGINAAVLNRVVITNSSVDFSIDFTNTNYLAGSPFCLLGFQKQIYTSTKTGIIYGTDDLGTCSAADLQAGTTHTMSIASILGIYDYDLVDDPEYIIMNLEFGNKSADRVESIDIATNQKFAVIIYDANDPDNIQTYNSSATYVQNQFDRRPGRLKALKGADFDKKIITFEPAITIENFKVTFTKYDNTPYNFHNREHLLTFELDVADYDPKYRY